MLLETSFCFQNLVAIVAGILQVQMSRFNMTGHISLDFRSVFTQFTIEHSGSTASDDTHLNLGPNWKTIKVCEFQIREKEKKV